MTPAHPKPGKKPKPPNRWIGEKMSHLASEPRCRAAGLPGGCWGPLDVHHAMPRGMGGSRGPTGPLVKLCRRHHQWVEEHRAEAKAMGLLLRRLGEGGYR